jgi:hypothetical protein
MLSRNDGFGMNGDESTASGRRRLPLVKKEYECVCDERRPMRATKTTAHARRERKLLPREKDGPGCPCDLVAAADADDAACCWLRLAATAPYESQPMSQLYHGSLMVTTNPDVYMFTTNQPLSQMVIFGPLVLPGHRWNNCMLSCINRPPRPMGNMYACVAKKD